MSKTFKFSVEELIKISEELPEDQDVIRLTGYFWSADRSTIVGGPDEVKCGGCNWEVGSLYVAAETREEAVDLLKSGDAGLCGECFAEYLSEAKV